MKVLIFGSSGLIGSDVHKFLKLKKKYKIYTIGRNNNNNIKFDLDKVKEFKIKQKIDIVIYCSGVTNEELDNGLKNALNKNIINLKNIINYFKKNKISKFIYISSAHVYGNLNKKINENARLEPTGIYSILHFIAEDMIKDNFKNYTIIRPNAVFGEIPKNFKRNSLIPFSFPISLAKHKKIKINSHGKQIRNFVSTKTISKIIYREINKKKSSVINAIGYYTISIIEFAKFCIKTLDPDAELIVKKYSNKKFNFKYTSDKYIIIEDPSLLINHIKKIYQDNKNEK